MPKWIFTIACAAAATVVAGGGAMAQSKDQQRTSVSAGLIRDQLREMGYKPTLSTDGSGDPRVGVRVDGFDWDIFFYTCATGSNEDRGCESYQFFTGYTVPKSFALSKLNAWNTERRYAQAHLFKLSSGPMNARIQVDVMQRGTDADPAMMFRTMVGKMKFYAAEFRKALGCSSSCEQIEMNQVTNP